MRVLLFLFFVFLFVGNCLGQHPSDIKRTYNWHFGNKAGLDFSSGTPVPITNSAMTAEEGCASISDTCGNLLFYTDGDTVWNSNNDVMPNGTGLMGCWSSTQSSLIVPQPGNDSLYYIFLTDCGEHFGGINGLRYSIVNINGNNGLGEVIQKNTLLHAKAMEKLTGTHHANGQDIWILGVNQYPAGPPPDTNYQYYAYLLTSTGLNTPIISPSAIHPPMFESGTLCFSHQGTKIANLWHTGCTVCFDTTEIMDFDKLTGILSNSILLKDDSTNILYGSVFSNDDSKLYISSLSIERTYPNWYSSVYQYDLSSNDSMLIAASRKLIHYSDSTDTYLPFYMGMQITDKDEIIVAKINNRINFYPSFVDKIDSANTSGVYHENAISLGTRSSQAGLPNFISSYFLSNWQSICGVMGEISPVQDNAKIIISPNPFTDYTTIEIISPQELKNKKAELKIYDILGREINRNIINPTEKIIFYREAIPRGTYILNIEIEHQLYYSQKIIII